MRKTASEIIDALGGTSAVAARLGRTPSTVSSWREVNFIPDWWQPPILAMASELEIDLVEDDFPSREARLSRKQAAA